MPPSLLQLHSRLLAAFHDNIGGAHTACARWPRWNRATIIGVLFLAACGGNGGGSTSDDAGNGGSQSAETFVPLRTFYVSPSGADTNIGSAAAPWRSLQYAAARAQPGDLISVADGDYAGFASVSSGSAQHAIAFKAAGAGAVISHAAAQDHIAIGHDYVIVEGFRVRNARRAGIAVIEARGVVVRKNVVGPNTTWGIFTGFAPGVRIVANTAFGSAGEHGIYVSNSRVTGDDPLIRGNAVYGNAGNGIQLNGDCYAGGDGVIEGAVVENNTVYNNGGKGLSLISIADGRVRNNLLYDNGGAGGIHLTDETDSAGFCGKPTTRTVVVNNTIRERDSTAAIRLTDGANANTLFNNVVVGGNGIVDETGGNAIAHNVASHDANAVFLDAGADDYRLSATSPARNVAAETFNGATAPATDIVDSARPQGVGRDAGAYERD